MKRWMFLLCALCSSAAWANWNSWDKPPAPYQMYMYVKKDIVEGQPDRYYYIISQYDKENPHLQDQNAGWFDVTPSELWAWIHSAYTVVYLPLDWKDADKMDIPLVGPSYIPFINPKNTADSE